MSSVRARALLSVSDKTGLLDFARGLQNLGVALISTGGTARALQDAGLTVTEVAEYTGFPEMLDGRVKTLHPKVHGGILARRDLDDHRAVLAAHDIPTIELVVVNLYPFEETVAKPACRFDDAIENIDIGGPAMVRSAAKNFAHVGVVVDPGDYPRLLEELAANELQLSDATRFELAKKAFAHTAAYDGAISNYLGSHDRSGQADAFPERWSYQGTRVQTLRYGENPHQSAAFYRDLRPAPATIAGYRQLQGKELSYNNIADSDAAWECVKTLAGAGAAACVIVKHANPCGVAVANTPLEAYRRAFATDPTSAFGGIIAFGCAVDAETVEQVGAQFVEVLIAPAFTADALAAISRKVNVRVLEIALAERALQSGRGSGRSSDPASIAGPVFSPSWDMKRVGGGLLLQTLDADELQESALKVVTRIVPTPAQRADLLFAWRVAKFVKSNAIVFCKDGRTMGVGAGQMSRVDSTRIAALKAKTAGLSLLGSVVASDAFFPFRDGLDVVAESGAVAVIQPGGSVRDDEVIAAADERGLAMVFTGVRHFRH